MDNIGLILEGGGLRGIYTSGVLDFFMEKNIYFPYIIGVSAGALNSLSYLARQIGRSKEIAISLTKDKKLVNIRNIFKNKDVFGFDYYFNEISEEINPFDYYTFNNCKEKLTVCCTDSKSGEAIYFNNSDKENIFHAIKASSTLPIMNEAVKINDKELFDGCIAEPIPLKKSNEDGFSKNVVILTNHKNYIQKPFRWKMLLKTRCRNYKRLIEIIESKHNYYNNIMKELKEAETRKEVFVFSPSKYINLSKYRRNEKKLNELYNLGYEDAKNNYNEFSNWIIESCKR